MKQKELKFFTIGYNGYTTYLKNAGLLSRTKRGFIKITDRGLNVLKQNPLNINNDF